MSRLNQRLAVVAEARRHGLSANKAEKLRAVVVQRERRLELRAAAEAAIGLFQQAVLDAMRIDGPNGTPGHTLAGTPGLARLATKAGFSKKQVVREARRLLAIW